MAISLEIPKIKFLAKLSPIKDSEPESKDSSAYQTVISGSKAKISEENEQIFLASGQNFFFSLVIVASWVFMTVFEQCLSSNNRFLWIISFIYRTTIGLMFFDFESITVAEIAFFDYKRAGEIVARFKHSLLLSVITLILILVELLSSMIIIPEKVKKMRTAGGAIKKKQEDFDSVLTPSSQMIFEKYTEVVDLDEWKRPHSHLIVVVGDIRFFVFQIVIVSLQHLNRSQSLLVLVVNLIYFLYFAGALLTNKIFKTAILTIKHVVQEICILVFIGTITLFSFTEKSEFSQSNAYKWIEYVTIASIIGACRTEFLTFLTELGSQLILTLQNLCKCQPNQKKKGRIEEIAKAQIEDKEFLDFGEPENQPAPQRRRKSQLTEKQPFGEKKHKKMDSPNIFSGRNLQGRRAQIQKLTKPSSEGQSQISIFKSEKIGKTDNRTKIDISIQ